MTDPAKAQSSDYYFDSYSHFGIHEDMLKDKVRTLSYRDAIRDNPSIIRGKVVLDVGCGTGILSMFAAKYGARHVYAVEKSSIVEYAKQIIEENHFSDIITVIQGGMEDVDIPEKVDVIISEWMGYALLYESMLPSVISARDRFMAPHGTMFPSHAKMHLAAIEDREYRAKKIDFWDDVYGFNYEPIKKWALTEPLVEQCPEERIITEDCLVGDFDLNKVTKEDLSVHSNFELWPTSAETMHAFVLWFDVTFEGGEKEVELTTSPYSPLTHWSQSIFYLERPVRLNTEEPLLGTFDMVPNERNPRDQDFVFAYRVGSLTFKQSFKMR